MRNGRVGVVDVLEQIRDEEGSTGRLWSERGRTEHGSTENVRKQGRGKKRREQRSLMSVMERCDRKLELVRQANEAVEVGLGGMG
jgi:hypothetical protein